MKLYIWYGSRDGPVLGYFLAVAVNIDAARELINSPAWSNDRSHEERQQIVDWVNTHDPDDIFDAPCGYIGVE